MRSIYQLKGVLFHPMRINISSILLLEAISSLSFYSLHRTTNRILIYHPWISMSNKCRTLNPYIFFSFCYFSFIFDFSSEHFLLKRVGWKRRSLYKFSWSGKLKQLFLVFSPVHIIQFDSTVNLITSWTFPYKLSLYLLLTPLIMFFSTVGLYIHPVLSLRFLQLI